LPGKKYYFWRNLPAQKFRWAKIVVILFFTVFACQPFQLQVIKGGYYRKKAERNRIQYFNIPAPRGRIFDTNGTELAGNQPRYSLYAALQGISIDEKNSIATKISALIGYPKQNITNRLNSRDLLPFQVVKLVSHLSSDSIAKIEENIHHFPNVFIQKEPRRKYPYGTNGAHLLGYIGEINKQNLINLKKYGYRLKDKIGKSGVEKVYDMLLRGTDGFQEVEVGVSGKHRRIVRTQQPQIGNDLLVTLDINLQEAAKKAMGDRNGAVVAMNPSTGEILVWLSQPGFNPEDFTLPLTRDKAREIFQDPAHPLFNRVIQGQYAPGSIFKLVTAIAALEQDAGNIDREYTCNGYIKIGYDNRVFRCWKDSRHGSLTLPDAIANSCNVYFYQLGMHVMSENIYNTAKKMNLGETSQTIFDGEESGTIPDNKWKKTYFGIGWYPGDTANMSVGQGYVLVNPLQLLKTISTIATEGKMYAPYILKMVVSPESKVIDKMLPRLEKQVDISVDIFKNIKDGMKRVTEYGTAQFLRLPLEVASKTGTAQSPTGIDNGWYACFAPIDKPEIAIIVLVEGGGYGSVSAMPVAREILKAKFLNEKRN